MKQSVMGTVCLGATAGVYPLNKTIGLAVKPKELQSKGQALCQSYFLKCKLLRQRYSFIMKELLV